MPDSAEILEPRVNPTLDRIVEELAHQLRDGFWNGEKLAMAVEQPEPENLIARMRYLDDCKRAEAYDELLTHPTTDTMEALATQESARLAKKELQATGNANREPAAITINLLFAAIRHLGELSNYAITTHPKSSEVIGLAYTERLLHNLALETASHFYGLKNRQDYLKAMEGVVKGISNYPEEFTAWAGWQCQKFETYLVGSFSVLDIFMQQEQLDPVEVVALKTEADQLWAEAETLRRYGVKPAIAPTNLPGLHEIGVRAGFEMIDELAATSKKLGGNPENVGRYTLRGARATFIMSNLPQARSGPKVEVQYAGNKPETALGAIMPINRILDAEQSEIKLIGSKNILATVQLRSDGHLYTFQGTPLERWAYQLGCPESYEQLRLECLSLYYDLVVPVYIQRMAKAQIVKQFGVGRSVARLKEMAVVRRRILEDFEDEIVAKLDEEEAEQADAFTSAKRRAAHQQSKDRIVVTGHPRELPEDFCAGVEARERALKEDGRILPDTGMTWVRFHERGSDGELEIAKIKPRKKSKYGNRQFNRHPKAS